MIIYNVTVNIDFDVHDDWLNWMKSEHIPDVMNTGLFLESKISRVIAEEEGGKTYAIQYLCESMEIYEDYKNNHAALMQSKHNAKFAGKFVVFRTLLRVEKSFNK